MAEIIKERERKSRVEVELNFYREDTGELCYGFPVVDGKVEPYTEEGMKNYISLRENKDYYSVLEERTVSWIQPAVAICECGREIELSYDAEECPYCGRLHNLFGQQLLPRKYWECDGE